MGRSYGDSCQNEHGILIQTTRLDKFIQFDPASGRLRAEAGVTLQEIARLTLPHGWFHAVTPGTQYVTLGGAIANDVHGKNHHRAGSFGNHVTAFELLRSDGTRLECSPDNNPEWFAATVGGLGLTGLITWAEVQLKQVKNEWLEVEYFPFSSIHAFNDLNQALEDRYEYIVAWLNCTSKGSKLGRGILMCANHADGAPSTASSPSRSARALPFDWPGWVLNAETVRLFNSLYYRVHQAKSGKKIPVHYQPFFYPLDGIEHWYRMYGEQGFLQFQCVIPEACKTPALTDLLNLIAKSGQASFLSVLKKFGHPRSLGMLSFPRPGITLAMDFPMRGATTLSLLSSLADVVIEAGGALYPAKDACMSVEAFRQAYPEWQAFSRYIDPAFSSSFWRRVTSRP